MKAAIIFASMVALVACTTDRPCEDAPIDCAQKDLDMAICKDPTDSAAYCPRYCGLCTGPTPKPTCRDYDKQCFQLVNSEYCKTNIARELCAKSCGICAPPTTTEATTTTTTEEITTTAQRFTQIPDPNCQDIDPNCIVLLQIHYCTQEAIVRKLCQRSCAMCPLVTVPVEGNQGFTTNKPGITTTGGSVTDKVCRDYDPICDEPGTVDNCTSTDLIQRLCPLTCGVCVPPPTQEGETTPGLPVLNPFTPGSDCYDNDPDCPALIQSYNCSSDQIVIRLCPASCNLCQSAATTPSTNVTGTPVECKDYSEDCDQLQPSCSFDPLVVRLCRKTCNAAPCNAEGTTVGVTEPQTPPPMTTGVPVIVTDDGMTTDNDVTTTPAGDNTSPAAVVTTAPPAVDTTPADVDTTPGDVDTTPSDAVTSPDDVITSGVPVTAEPATSTKTLPSLNPTATPDCYDRDSQCASLVQSFYCDTNDLLRRICPSSCNLCVRTTPSGVQETTPGGCVDFDPQCPTLQNFCQREDLLVNRLCRKTCGLCDVDIVLPPKQDPLPLTCRVCVDPFCEREVESITKCPEETPYCGSRVINNADGTHGLTKRCASKLDCDNGYAGTAAGNETLCSNFDPNVIVQEPFICFFCCRTNECNRHAKPDPDTLYTKN